MRCLFALLMLVANSSVIAVGATRTIDVNIEHRTVTVPGPVIRVTEGKQLLLRWHSDEAVELHLHGYDIELDVEPGTPADMNIDATASGRFPVTSHGFGGEHHGHQTLLYLEVYPD